MRAMEQTPSAGPSAFLEVRGLTKRYGNVQALVGLDLTVKAGEIGRAHV